ncbi:MAG: DUF3604 domain-containing protein [Deltaproteobacteria bacterium]|nr:DUF3604 domain-containing protein [Deltaproteobacteria bacterium]
MMRIPVMLTCLVSGVVACDGGSARPPGDVANSETEDGGSEGLADDAGAESEAGDTAEDGGDDDGGWEYTEEREPCAARNPVRNAYWGDLHAHSRLSFDAYGYDLRVTPDEVYAFAKGGEVRLPPLDGDGVGTRVVRLDRPLDFAALTDHLDLVGEVRLCTAPGSSAYDTAECAAFRAGGEAAVADFGILLAGSPPRRIAAICGADGTACAAAAAEVWGEMREAAEAAYDRTAACGFVSFVGYEYTATPMVSNLHRLVVFRTAAVPERPPTVFEQPTPLGLWTELAATCLDAGIGCDAISLPHNSNWSNGRLFALDYGGAATLDEQRTVATLRARLEPVFEIFQHKGNQECSNGFAAVLGLPDPVCDFEQIRLPPFEDCGDGVGSGGVILRGCVSALDFARNVLKAGMQEEERLGINPYRLGFLGATDTHNGTPGNVGEVGFPGHVGLVDDTPVKRLGDGTVTHDGLINNPGGLAAVWAEERSRDAIFEAIRRRETFATSGPRITVRFFAGWDYPSDLCGRGDLPAVGYAQGVPMGGDLPPWPGAGAPSFVVRAEADPGTAEAPGTPLQRVQIVKGWIGTDGTAHERVFDVAGDPDGAAYVDPATCERSGTGHDSLCAVWTDPEFDAAARAFWYVRVLEVPTCRWSARDCLALDPADRPAVCSDPAVSHEIRERAWSSPVWYAPVSGTGP